MLRELPVTDVARNSRKRFEPEQAPASRHPAPARRAACPARPSSARGLPSLFARRATASRRATHRHTARTAARPTVMPATSVGTFCISRFRRRERALRELHSFAQRQIGVPANACPTTASPRFCSCRVLRAGQRFAPALPAQQKDGQRFLVVLLVFRQRLHGRGLAQQRFGLAHLPLVLVRSREQVEVVHVMPVELAPESSPQRNTPSRAHRCV